MSKFPICVVIYLTDYCKVKCKHCFFTQTNCIDKNMMDFKTLKKLLLTFKKNKVFMIAFTGGDPMLYPHIFDILKYTNDLGMFPLLGISGTNMTNNKCKKLYECGVRCVQIGLNGSTSELNDVYRGNGIFLEVLDSIKKLQLNNINVNLAFCLDKNNYLDLKNMLNLAAKLKIYKVKVEFWTNTCKSTFNLKHELNEDDKECIRKLCDEYMAENNKNEWIQYPKSSSHLSKIHSNAIVIMPNGEVKRNELGQSLGNIYTADILKIMESE